MPIIVIIGVASTTESFMNLATEASKFSFGKQIPRESWALDCVVLTSSTINACTRNNECLHPLKALAYFRCSQVLPINDLDLGKSDTTLQLLYSLAL